MIYHLNLLIQIINLHISLPNLLMKRDWTSLNMILAWLMVLLYLDYLFKLLNWLLNCFNFTFFVCEIMLRLSFTLIIDYIDFDLNIFLIAMHLYMFHSSSKLASFFVLFFVCSSLSVWFIFSIFSIFELWAVSLFYD